MSNEDEENFFSQIGLMAQLFDEDEDDDDDTIIYDLNEEHFDHGEEGSPQSKEQDDIAQQYDIIDEYQLMAEQIPNLYEYNFDAPPMEIDITGSDSRNVELMEEDLDIVVEQYPPQQPSPQGDIFMQPVPQPTEPTDWKEQVNLMNADFIARYSYPPTRFPTEDNFQVNAGFLYAIQIAPNQEKKFNGANTTHQTQSIHVDVMRGRVYNVFCNENLKYVIVEKSGDHANQEPALVKIFSIPGNNMVFPEIPIRRSQDFRAIAIKNITIQIRLFDSDVEAESMNDIPADYILPLVFELSDTSVPEINCETNVGIRCRYLGLGHAVSREITFMTRPVLFPEPIQYPELLNERELWKINVHRLNQDIRLFLGYKAAYFITPINGGMYNVISKTLCAFQLPSETAIRIKPGQSNTLSSITARVTPGVSYLIVRRSSEVWDIISSVSISPGAGPALVRVLTIPDSGRHIIPFRSNVACVTFFRAGIDYFLQLLPSDLDRFLIQKFDQLHATKEIQLTPTNQNLALYQHLLRLDLMSIYKLRIVQQGTSMQAASVFICDFFGTADAEMAQMTNIVNPQKESDFYCDNNDNNFYA